MASTALPMTAPQDHARDLPYNARIANAIGYVAEHYQEQPSLEEMAGAANLSPSISSACSSVGLASVRSAFCNT
jgi:AraC-like DNA-binding protein